MLTDAEIKRKKVKMPIFLLFTLLSEIRNGKKPIDFCQTVREKCYQNCDNKVQPRLSMTLTWDFDVFCTYFCVCFLCHFPGSR